MSSPRADKIPSIPLSADTQSEEEDSVQEYHVERDEDGEMISRTRIPRTPVSAKKVDFLATIDDIESPVVVVADNQLRQRRESESLVAFPENRRSNSALRANSSFKVEMLPGEVSQSKPISEDDKKPSKICGSSCALI